MAEVLTVATLLWDRNDRSLPSSNYSDFWVDRLYRSFARNLTVPFRFTCFVDRLRGFAEDVHQVHLSTDRPDYSHCIEPYRLGAPMILVGLDTVVCRNIDHLAEWCFRGDRIALNRDKRDPTRPINGVALVPRGWQRVHEEWRGENDMEWVGKFPWEPIDDRWPDQVVSYKMRVRANGDALSEENRIVFMHGDPKQDALGHLDWVAANWS